MATAPPRDDTKVRVLTLADLDTAARVLAIGFAEEPGNAALFPDPELRRAVQEAGARSALEDTIPYGTAHAAFVGEELAAVALWHAPGMPTSSLGGALRTARGLVPAASAVVRALPHVSSVVLHQRRTAFAFPRARRRAIAPASAGASWHLAFLATAPEHRGKGLARALLERQLQRCDEDGVAVWLETTDPVNPPIYERFGFEVTTYLAEAAWLPGFWVMRREPRTG